MDECGLPNSARANHEHYRAGPSYLCSNAWSTNGFQDSIKRFQESWMLDEAAVLKVLKARL
jgi:hypothetical protein